MKRTNLVLDEKALEETRRLSGKRTYSDAVNEALKEYCRLRALSKIFEYRGSKIWEGNLAEMRRDRSR